MTLGCLLALVGVAAVDWFSGPDLQVLLLYLVPVMAAAWYAGPRIGTLLALATVGTSFVIAVATPDGHSPAIAAVNALLRLALLLLGLAVINSERRHVDQLQEFARIDPLTRALNRRAFVAEVEPTLRAAGAAAGSMLYLDIDGLKVVNDREGHEAGDAHLTTLADIVRASIREGDQFARLGGDEFAVFLRGQDVATAEQVANRLVESCRSHDGRAIRLSVGVAGADGDTVAPLLRRADDVMYAAKQAGGGVRIAVDERR